MNSQEKYATLGIDIGSTTVKIAILDENHNILFSDYERHFANIRETLSGLLKKAYDQLGELQLHPMITGSGGLTLANHLGVPFTQEVVGMLGKMIMDAMEEYIAEHAENSKIDKRVEDKVNKVADKARELAEELQRKVTIEELMEETGMSRKLIEDAVRMSGFKIEDIDNNAKDSL